MSEGTWLNVSLVAAIAAFVAGLASAVRGGKKAGLERWLLAGSAASLALGLAVRWRQGGHVPLANQYESLVFAAFVTSCVVPFLRGCAPWVIALAGMAVALMLALAGLVRVEAAPLVPALQSNWLLIHVSVAMGSYAAFVLSAAASAWLLLRRFLPGPPADDLDGFSYRCVMAGFFLLATGIITGAVWAERAWGRWWSWDPKETWALITWLTYAVALHLRRTRGWRREKFAWLSLAGLAAVAFTYFGVNYLMAGLHSYATG